jgi:hypothetical protein
MEIYRLDNSYNWILQSAPIPTLHDAFVFAYPGTVAAGALPMKIPVWKSMTVTNVRLHVGTAPSGSSLVLDINKNGSANSMFSSSKPTITTGNTTSYTNVPNQNYTLVAGDYINIDIDSIGGPAADLTIVVEYTSS